MGAPRKDTQVDAMYALYQSGHSLSQVARAFAVTRQSVYKCFRLRAYVLRQRPTPLPFVVFYGYRYTLRAKKLYYARTNSGRHYLHRDVWQHHHGLIPPGHDVHHRDGDRLNNHVSNLELIEKAEHTRLHQHAKRTR